MEKECQKLCMFMYGAISKKAKKPKFVLIYIIGYNRLCLPTSRDLKLDILLAHKVKSLIVDFLILNGLTCKKVAETFIPNFKNEVA